MKPALLFLIISFSTAISFFGQGIIVNHNFTKINQIPEAEITNAKEKLHIAYGHTSRGSQLITGMNNLDNFMRGSGLYNWNDGSRPGSLDIDDYFANGDLGSPDRITWASRTREYLEKSNNSDVNVVIWSWCGQVSSATENDITTYLNLMTQLETEFPNVKFVYMTGHLDGTGLTGNLHLRNEQIRKYCKDNNKILYDFADIESYDPDGNYFGDKIPNENCDYDSDGDGTRDANWAKEWQGSHTQEVDWYDCCSAHSQSLNANQKAYAAWSLWATLAGWNGITSMEESTPLNDITTLNVNYPNPFNPTTNISFSLSQNSKITLEIFNTLGEKVRTLANQNYSAGNYSSVWNGKDDLGKMVNSGIYIYKLVSDNYVSTKKMVLLK